MLRRLCRRTQRAAAAQPGAAGASRGGGAGSTGDAATAGTRGRPAAAHRGGADCSGRGGVRGRHSGVGACQGLAGMAGAGDDPWGCSQCQSPRCGVSSFQRSSRNVHAHLRVNVCLAHVHSFYILRADASSQTPHEPSSPLTRPLSVADLSNHGQCPEEHSTAISHATLAMG